MEVAGEQRPEGYPPGCRCRKFSDPEGAATGPVVSELGALAVGGSEQTAAVLLRRLLGQIEPEQDPAGLARAFADVFGEYLDRLRRLNKVEPWQITDYRRSWERHVADAVVSVPGKDPVGPLGVVPVVKVTAEVVKAWVAWMSERTWTYSAKDKTPKPYGPKTIANLHGTVISPVLAFAAVRGYIDANPAAGVELPRRRSRTVTLDRVPTGDEPELWIGFGYEVSVLSGDIITIAFGTGLRWGEITALRPCDINLAAEMLTINQVVKQDENRRPYLASYGKTDAAQRTIRLPQRVLTVLSRRMQGVPERGLIFTGVRGGILSPTGNWHKNHWSKVVARAAAAGIVTQATPHKLRHSHSTSLLGANVSIDTVSKRLGHSTLSTTSDLYGHLAPEADNAAVNVIDQIMGDKPLEVVQRPPTTA